MRWSAGLAVLGSLLAFLPASPAEALVGTVDTNDQFPFVVRLQTEYADGSASWCSGVVHGHVLSTAAHCLYNSDPGIGHGLAVKVTVPYVDTLGRRRTAHSRKLFVPRSYIDDDLKYAQSYQGAPHDIAYIALDQAVLVNGYIHWGLELLENLPPGKHECEEPECMDWSLTEERKAAFLQNLQSEVGDLNNAKMRIIGYGNYKCEDYKKREQNCVSDGQRRYVELKLKPDVTLPSAPWLWCSGRGVDGVNPVQHGDSGGPVFVQALDGRWLYVGYTSRGDSNDGCASSMFNELNLWRNALANQQIEAQGVAQPSDDEILSWHEGISRQFFREWLRNETANASTALERLKGFYMVPFGVTLDPRFRDGALSVSRFIYHGRKMSFNDVYREKQRYFEQWPQRTLSPTSVSVDCDETELHSNDTCTISADLDWTSQNSQRQFRGQSQLTLTLSMPFAGSLRLLFFEFNPLIVQENGANSLGSGPSAGQTLRQVKQGISSGYLNMRVGPGQDQAVLAQIPAGESVSVSSGCIQPTDGVSRFPFCPVIWNGRKGWVSASGLE
jgi:Trypsin/Bacterial SH3 domain